MNKADDWNGCKVEHWQARNEEECDCPDRIPGLDAVGCRTCKAWWGKTRLKAARAEPPPKKPKDTKKTVQLGSTIQGVLGDSAP